MFSNETPSHCYKAAKCNTPGFSTRFLKWFSKKMKSLKSYWFNPDKFVALVVASSSLMVISLFGSIVLTVLVALGLGVGMSYHRANHSSIEFRFVLHNLFKYPKFKTNALKLVQHTWSPSPSLKLFDPYLNEIITPTRATSFPLSVVLLAKPLNPNDSNTPHVAGYALVESLKLTPSTKLKDIEEELLKNQSKSQLIEMLLRNDLNPDLLDAKHLFAYYFGHKCILRTFVIGEKYRSNGFAKVLFAYVLKKLRDIGEVDCLICKSNSYVEEHLLDLFFGQRYTPMLKSHKYDELGWFWGQETIYFPVYKKKLELRIDDALENFLVFERVKKSTIPYFVTKKTKRHNCENIEVLSNPFYT